MVQCVFEIDVLARYVSCHLVSFSRNAAVSLARTRKMLEVPARVSSLWNLQDSLSVLSNVLPSTDEETERGDFGNREYRFRRYTSWMRRLFLKAKDQQRATDDAINRLNGSTRVPKPTPSHMLPLKGDFSQLDLEPTFQAPPAPYLHELIINFGSQILNHFKDEISTMIQRCGDSLRTLQILTYLTEAEVNLGRKRTSAEPAPPFFYSKYVVEISSSNREELARMH